MGIDWTKGQQLPLPTIHPYSLESLGGHIVGTGSSHYISAASATYPTANLAIFFPFVLASPVLIAQLWAYNGLTVSGNIDVGIYDVFGTRLVSAGSTVQAGVSAIQKFNIADTMLCPGRFFMAIAMDNIVGTLFRTAVGSLQLLQTAGVLQQASAFPLPAAATLAANAQVYIPIFGLALNSVM